MSKAYNCRKLRKMGGGKLASLLAVAFCATAFMPSFAESKSSRLLCYGYAGTTSLTNFQALVKLSPENDYGFAYSDCTANDGSDLWFTDSSGNLIPHEVDAWTENGDSFVWVKIPEVLPSSDANFPTAITMHWGDAAEKVAHPCTTTDTWAGYAGVWHMNGTVVSGTAQSEPDATGHNLDAVPKGVYGTYNLSAMARTSGIVGNGRVNQTADSYVQGLKVPDYSAYLTSASQFTISGWWSATALNTYPRFATSEGTSNYWAIVGYDNDGNSIDRWQKIQGIYSNGESGNGKSGSVTGVFAIDSFKNPNWVYLTVVWNGTTVTAYSNGSQKYTKSNMVAQTESDTGFMIGCAENAATKNPTWRGYYDEVRMYDGAASADRIAADYATMTTPTEFIQGDDSITTATWTGTTGDGDGTNALNWECRNPVGIIQSGKLPNAATKIVSSTLSGNADWLGLGFAPVLDDDSVIDLNAYNLSVSGLAGGGTITNSVSGDAAQLCVSNVAAVTNSTVAIGGNLKLVKRGSGVFTSSKAQTYTGGTVVDLGTIQAPQSTDTYDASFTVFGAGKITVNSNAVFNAQSTVAYRNGIVLNGGTIKGGAGDGLKRPVVMLEQVTAPSAIDQSVKAIDIGAAGTPIDLGGNTVYVSIANATYFRWYGSIENTIGRIVATNIGYFTEFPVNAPTVDLDLSCRVHFQDEVHVRDYRAANGDLNNGTGTGLGMYVNGVYTPVGEYYHGCTMQDGSTLDLSGRSGCFSVKSNLQDTTDTNITGYSSRQIARKTVQFASGAAVTVNLAGRADLETIAASAENYIVKWSADAGGEPSGVTFRLDAATAQRYRLKSDATGLRLNKKKGFIIIVK
ncbi:MAG: hypothetical protein IJI54_15195 [Kiritimatiellae bacterium]|nr:hypothetical protein [Kiritimatiellia bacterium]